MKVPTDDYQAAVETAFTLAELFGLSRRETGLMVGYDIAAHDSLLELRVLMKQAHSVDFEIRMAYLTELMAYLGKRFKEDNASLRAWLSKPMSVTKRTPKELLTSGYQWDMAELIACTREMKS